MFTLKKIANHLTLHLKTLQRKEKTKPQSKRWKEILFQWIEKNKWNIVHKSSRIDKTEGWFLGKINKIDKTLARLTKREK